MDKKSECGISFLCYSSCDSCDFYKKRKTSIACKYLDFSECTNSKARLDALVAGGFIEEPKLLRIPDEEGVLPLTKKELIEFGDIIGILTYDIEEVRILGDDISYKYQDWESFETRAVTNIRAIEWLLKRFDLGGEGHEHNK